MGVPYKGTICILSVCVFAVYRNSQGTMVQLYKYRSVCVQFHMHISYVEMDLETSSTVHTAHHQLLSFLVYPSTCTMEVPDS